MPTIDPDLWPAAVVVAIIAIGLVARWLRGSAVQDPERLADEWSAEEGSAEPASVEHADDAGFAEEEGDDEDELAPLGVAPQDRPEFLELLAERGAVALLLVPADPKEHARAMQHEAEDGTVTMPVFTSERKAYAYGRALGRAARAEGQSFDSLAVDAAFLVQGDFQVVVNPSTDFETELTAEDLRTLAAFADVEEREPVDPSALDDVAEPAADDDEPPPRQP